MAHVRLVRERLESEAALERNQDHRHVLCHADEVRLVQDLPLAGTDSSDLVRNTWKPWKQYGSRVGERQVQRDAPHAEGASNAED